ncbi:ThiF family adenylyltransferase [Methanobacterium aggregans]|uniref:ThiF family adenylyltransferase n=1 Tax=Methanobacterium aggregans TaxID=1615586 RepID=UPI001AEB1A65|nr:ThiF family adenylyltransferase [Methanobacterium aggregans]MBP2045254.1 adenylyltransferase/sulfurtransferase [Methanobacterium aggregans]
MQSRYSRQIILQNIKEEGQEKLLKSSVVIVGCGALGTVAANNLARAGVGKIFIIDRDFVELNNLQRQMLFDEKDVGEPKAVAAAKKASAINSEIEIIPVIKDLNHTNVEELLSGADIVLDGTDNIQTRMLVNDVCVKNGVPWVYTGAIGTSGMMMKILPGKACLRCLYPGIPKPGSLPTCDTMGVLNTITVIMGSMESTEAIKILLGKYNEVEDTKSELIVYDGWNNSYDSITVKKNDSCGCCVDESFEYLESEEREIITSLCGRNAIQITPADPKEILLRELASKLEKLGKVKCADFIMIFKTGEFEISVFKDGRAIVKGTNDEKVARSIYARYIGT